MRLTRFLFALSAVLMAAAITPASVAGSRTLPIEQVLYSFSGGTDGGWPQSSLIVDGAGNLYGTTGQGGDTKYSCEFLPGCGVVFELTPTSHGGELVLYRFTGGKDGGLPRAGLALGANKKFFGTTMAGGDLRCGYLVAGCGVVFELAPTSHGGWVEKVLHTFTGSDGANPTANLIVDAAGNLFGTATYGGMGCLAGCGVVFELCPTSNGNWKEIVIHKFTGADGSNPAGSLSVDALGNLYGVTWTGGPDNRGVVFELESSGPGKWKERTLSHFDGKNGSDPWAGLTFDAAGNLYGTTVYGGSHDCNDGCGVVFKLTRTCCGDWKETVIHAFTKVDGAASYGKLVGDTAGNLYGTTLAGGVGGYNGDGVAFELTPTSDGIWSETLLHAFNGTDGVDPVAGFAVDAVGNLYGTTAFGGARGAGYPGVVFELKLDAP